MRKKAEGKFNVLSWKEETIKELNDEVKMTRATVEQNYSGGLVGNSFVVFSMVYLNDKKARFVGVEHFQGEMDGKNGTMIIQHDGIFENAVASSHWTVIDGSGTDELTDISGEGKFKTEDHGKASYEFAYSLEK